jgi:predicted HD phosphohydrolase
MGLASTKDVQEHLRYIFDLLSRQDDSTYIGEAISQLAHSLQAAHLAVQAGSSECTAIAALFHDIGQVLPMDEKSESRQEANILDESGKSVGRVGHELIGEVWLRRHGWPEEVCQLVGAHVMAKR